MKNFLAASLVLAFVGYASGCCSFNGRCYKPGYTIPNICYKITCIDGDPDFWSNKGFLNKCEQCFGQNGINFFDVFSGSPFTFNGNCNYALAVSTSPSYSVTSVIGPCPSDPSSSCFIETTLTINEPPPPLVVVYDHNNPTVIQINGVTYPVTGQNPTQLDPSLPLFTWNTWDGCIAVQGLVDLSLFLCPDSVRLYTSPGNVNNLYGLCLRKYRTKTAQMCLSAGK